MNSTDTFRLVEKPIWKVFSIDQNQKRGKAELSKNLGPAETSK